MLENGVAAGVDMIMVEATSPAVDKAGGIWAGMSGSPVYSDDGRFIGAVAYGLAFGPSKIGGLAAADDMVDVLDGNLPPAAQASKLPAGLRKELVATGAVTAREAAAGVERLRTPLAVSGLGAGRINAFANRLAGHERFIPFAAGAAAASPPPGDPDDIVPGGNFAAAISYGEITAAGVGTTTLVCDDKAVAFGHPFNFDGPTALSAHTADAILIQDDPLGAPFKLANIGGTVGTLDQDRLSGIRAVFGDPPDPVLVQSRVNDPAASYEDHETRVNRTQEVPDVAAFHLVSNIDGAIDRLGGGRSTLGWTVTGTAGGKQFSLTRNNRFADPFDISFLTPDELFSMLATIAQNPFVDVTFDQVKIDASVQFPFREYRITGVEQRVGSALGADRGLDHHHARSDPARPRAAGAGPQHHPDRARRVPPQGAGVRGRRRVARHHGRQRRRWRRRGGPATDSGEPETFDELLDALRKTPQNNQVIASLSFFGGGEGGETPSVPPVSQTKDAAEVVTGGTSISVSIPGEEPSVRRVRAVRGAGRLRSDPESGGQGGVQAGADPEEGAQAHAAHERGRPGDREGARRPQDRAPSGPQEERQGPGRRGHRDQARPLGPQRGQARLHQEGAQEAAARQAREARDPRLDPQRRGQHRDRPVQPDAQAQAALTRLSSAAMRISVAADEDTGVAGAVVAQLRDRGHEPILHGALAAGERDDWAWASEAAARDVAEGRADQAVVCCWTGTGASIAANKVTGIRAALCGDAETAAGARKWNDANVLALSLRTTSEAVLAEILDAWFAAGPSPDDGRPRERRPPRRAI